MGDPIPPIAAPSSGAGTRLGEERLAALRAGARLAGIEVHGAATTTVGPGGTELAPTAPGAPGPTSAPPDAGRAPQAAVTPGAARATLDRPAMALHVLTVDVAQLDALLARWGGRGPAPAPGPQEHPADPSPFAPPAPAPWRATPAGVGVRSATGIVGPLQEAGPHAVPREALTGDHRGASAKVFAVQVHPGVVDLVVVEADWSAGLPPGRRGAVALAEALGTGLEVTARPGHPPVEAEVTTVTGDLLLVRLHAPHDQPVRVAPVLGDAGYALFVQPGRVADVAAVPVATAAVDVQVLPPAEAAVTAMAGPPRGGPDPVGVPGGLDVARAMAAGAGQAAQVRGGPTASGVPGVAGAPSGLDVARSAAGGGQGGTGRAGTAAVDGEGVALDAGSRLALGVLAGAVALVVALVAGWLDMGSVALLVGVIGLGGALMAITARGWAGWLELLRLTTPPRPPDPPVVKVDLQAHHQEP